MKRRLAALIALVLLGAAPAAGAFTFKDGSGLRVISVKQLDPRLVNVTVKTAALPSPANVRILLPPGYAAHPDRRYPVFYLLHGTSGDASDWTVRGHAEQVIGGRTLITVMPDIALHDNGGGWCTNWPDGMYKWETFHITQLIPWIDRNLRTITSRAGRAIAGLSQGGFCSMSYAARHPDLFSVALGYSGAPDIWYDPDARAGARAIINATEVGLDGVPPNSMFGDPDSDGINWAAHDPATLAENLRATKLYSYFGNGQPGPFDAGPSNPGAMGIEELVHGDNVDFHNHLESLHIPSLYDDYGPGTHSWPYWERDLQWSIGPILADFAHPAPAPAAITYASADDRYSVYGWRVSMHRTAREFSTLEHASGRGFALAGSGSGTVVTPPLFSVGTRYRIALSAHHRLVLRAAGDRRLRIEVPLGPPNPYQQYTAQAQARGTAIYTTTVTITRLGR